MQQLSSLLRFSIHRDDAKRWIHYFSRFTTGKRSEGRSASAPRYRNRRERPFGRKKPPCKCCRTNKIVRRERGKEGEQYSTPVVPHSQPEEEDSSRNRHPCSLPPARMWNALSFGSRLKRPEFVLVLHFHTWSISWREIHMWMPTSDYERNVMRKELRNVTQVFRFSTNMRSAVDVL